MPVEVVKYRAEGSDELFDTLEEADRYERYVTSKNAIHSWLSNHLVSRVIGDEEYVAKTSLINVLINCKFDDYIWFLNGDAEGGGFLKILIDSQKVIDELHDLKALTKNAITIQRNSNDKNFMLIRDVYKLLSDNGYEPMAEDIYNRFLRGTEHE